MYRPLKILDIPAIACYGNACSLIDVVRKEGASDIDIPCSSSKVGMCMTSKLVCAR
jgi:hypothetical protein